MNKGLIVAALLLSVVALFFVFQKRPLSFTTPSPSPTPTKTMTEDQIKQSIVQAAQLREQGKYAEGEEKITQAFNAALSLNNAALTVEAGNNLSIQYRLTAGRLTRQGKQTEASDYSKKSLGVYQILRDRGWFSDTDPITQRSWAHSLLYAGKIDEALPALQTSFKLQTVPAAQGDENCHQAVALLSQGKLSEAQQLVDAGMKLIEANNGSKVWLTFCHMTQASLYAKQNQPDKAKETLNTALTIAKDNTLAVREEEITYLLSLDPSKIDVLAAVGAKVLTD